MNIHQRTDAFTRLGEQLEQVPPDIIHQAGKVNPWFTEENIRFALTALSEMLNRESIESFMLNYEPMMRGKHIPKTIGLVMAGNIPLVGFHDFFCVLLAGHHVKGKLSSDDPVLMKAITDMLVSLEPGFRKMISFTEGRLQTFDAIIATGSNNTSRYFEYYFGGYPHIIRRNRNGIAVLTGGETKGDLNKLGEDIFRYFGMGCRNVSKILVPAGYDWQIFIESIKAYAPIIDHHKYNNNYTYNKTILVMNQEPFRDTGFLLLKEAAAASSPLSVLHYEYYEDMNQILELLINNTEIQCIVSLDADIPGAVPPGRSQHPGLSDFADNVDTMEFLLGL